ncbi:protein-S-isoprenylcysteine O-methyltransferase [Dionaea muscipula]
MEEIFSYTAMRQLSQMFLAIILFHISEYFLAARIHGRRNVTAQSLLVSKHYVLAMVGSLLEYLIEMSFSPSLKEYWWLSNIGLAMVLAGEIIRKMAILTAGRSFTHLIKIYYEDHHKLITRGIYGFIRHPGYCGFLVWSIGTQVMLLNPICIVAFAVIVWHFFARRISYEEYFLRQFFGAEYEEYAQRVTSGVPFVK